MTDNYTPDEEQVRLAYVNHMSFCLAETMRDAEGDQAAAIYGPDADAEFDRFIARIKAEALREVARNYWGIDGDPDYPSTSGAVRRTLNKRADRIEGGTR